MELSPDAVNIYDTHRGDDCSETLLEEFPLSVNVQVLVSALKGIKDYQRMVMYVSRPNGKRAISMSHALSIMVVTDLRDPYVLEVPLLSKECKHETVDGWDVRFDMSMPLSELKDVVRKASAFGSDRIHFHVKRWSEQDSQRLIFAMFTMEVAGACSLFRGFQLMFTTILKKNPSSDSNYAIKRLQDAQLCLSASDPHKSGAVQVAESGIEKAETGLKRHLIIRYDELEVPRGFVKPPRFCTEESPLAECEREMRDLLAAVRTFEKDHRLKPSRCNPTDAVLAVDTTELEVASTYTRDIQKAPFAKEEIMALPSEYESSFAVKRLAEILKTPQCATVQLHLPVRWDSPLAMRFDAGGGDSQSFIAWIIAPLIESSS